MSLSSWIEGLSACGGVVYSELGRPIPGGANARGLGAYDNPVEFDNRFVTETNQPGFNKGGERQILH
jgi:hypothetical protein